MQILKKIVDVIKGKAPLSASRSTKWPKVRAEHLKKNSECAVCSGTKTLEVHHVQPFHEHPNLELDPNNLITLCESKNNGINCHLAFGHLGNYKNANPAVKEDAQTWNKKLKTAKK